LVAYAIHVGVELAAERGFVMLERIRDEVDGLGLLEGQGDAWLLEVVQRGPFNRAANGALVLEHGVTAADFPFPGKAPEHTA
jgi:hypothetical protein